MPNRLLNRDSATHLQPVRSSGWDRVGVSDAQRCMRLEHPAFLSQGAYCPAHSAMLSEEVWRVKFEVATKLADYSRFLVVKKLDQTNSLCVLN